MSSRILALLVICAVPVWGEAAWQTDLFLPGHDTWHARIPIELTNTSGGNMAGYPVSIAVGKGAEQIDLVGARARDMRVCDAGGTEMLFDLRDATGRRIEDGVISAGAVLTVPCAAPAGGRQRLFVYFDNPDTYFVPDYLSAVAEVANGGFESGANGKPAGWQFDAVDADHPLTWTTDHPHGGGHCLRASAPAGAALTWTTARQANLTILPGRRYRLTVWVRGEKVVGKAGWFVHIATASNPMLINRVESAGDGTFDWRKLTLDFTAPPDAVSLTHGSILRGSGSVWFDDVRLECLDKTEAVTVHVGAVERLHLDEIAGRPDYLRTDGHTWECRAPVYFINAGDALKQVTVQVDTARLRPLFQRGFNANSLRITDPVTMQVLPCYVLDNEVLFVADVPARCRKLFYAYISRDARIPAGPTLTYTDLVSQPANLARNPSFEAGDRVPADWVPMAEQQPQPTARMERVEGGRIGAHCARLTIAPDAPQHWTGWSQEIDVQPNATYLCEAYVRTEGVTDGKVRIHAHLLHGDGANAPQTFWSGGPDLTGTTDWTLLGGLLKTTADTRRVMLYLTTNARGTIYHDGVVFVRVAPAGLGELEERPAAGRPALRVWTENPIVKVFHDSPPAAAPAQTELFAARNGTACLQLCLRSAQAMADVKVTVEAPSRPGASLPLPRIERVGYVPVLQPSGFYRSSAEPWERRKPNGPTQNDGWEGWWPDYLVPAGGRVDLSANQTQPLWITFTVPKDAAPGAYRGAVRIEDPAGGKIALPFTLKVWKFVLPDRPSLQVIIDQRNGPGWSLFSTPVEVEKWWRFAAEHRISSDHVLPPPQFTLKNGHVTMDADAFDRAAKLRFDELHMAVAYFPQVFYACGWAYPPRAFLGLAYGTPEYRQAYREAVRLFWNHIKERGWADRFSLYVSDEPHYETHPEVVQRLGDIIRMAREVDPHIPIYASTWGHVPQWDGVLNHWGIAQYGKFPLDVLQQRLAAGDKVWFTTDGQFQLDTPYNACERLLPYYCFAYNVSGYEMWALCWYTYNPFKFGWYSFINQSDEPGKSYWILYPNGSGHLAYPGDLIGLDRPLSTVRLEEVREGLADYELYVELRRLEATHLDRKAEIDRLFADLRALVPIPNPGGDHSTAILPDPDAVPRLRQRAGELLDAVLP